MLIPTLEYCLAQAGCLFQRWNTAWPERGAYSNVGILRGLGEGGGVLIPTLEYCPGGVLIPTLEYCLAQAGCLFQRWKTAWPDRGAYSNVGILRGLGWGGAYSNVGMLLGQGGVLIPTLEYCLA